MLMDENAQEAEKDILEHEAGDTRPRTTEADMSFNEAMLNEKGYNLQ